MMVAEAVVPEPPLVELTAPVVLAKVPIPLARTFRLRVHAVFDAMDPPASEIVLAPAAAVAVPPQVFVKFGVVATARPDDSVFEKATPVSDTELGSARVKVSVAEPPSTMLAGLNETEIDGGAR
jgi:hypothetical protein